MLASNGHVSTTISMAFTFDSQYDCLMFGYKQSIVKMQQIGPEEVNKYNMYIRFICTPETTI